MVGFSAQSDYHILNRGLGGGRAVTTRNPLRLGVPVEPTPDDGMTGVGLHGTKCCTVH